MAYRRTLAVERRLAEIRERIAQAALDEVAAHGYGGTPMVAVASRAGVSTGGIYRHFPSKSDLFAEVFRRASAREVEVCRQAAEWPADSQLERLARVVETFARRALRGRRLAWALLAEPVDPAVEAERLIFRRSYRDVFAGLLEDGIAAGELPPQDSRLAAAALVGAIGEALVGPLSPTASATDPDTLIGGLVNFCLRSVTDQEPDHVHLHA
jgi:AcrR family transcriptional regulator